MATETPNFVINFLSVVVQPENFFVLLAVATAGGVCIHRWFASDPDRPLSGRCWLGFSLLSLMVFPGSVLAAGWLASLSMTFHRNVLYYWLGAALLGILLSLGWFRWVSPQFAWCQRLLTRRDSREDEPLDTRTVVKRIGSNPKAIDPRTRFDRKGRRLYLGSEISTPIYEALHPGKPFPHIVVAGTTGGGKGVLLGVLGAQFVRMGEAVIFIDPKFDEFAPSLFRQQCEAAGVRYQFVDLRPDAPHQFNLLAGCSANELFELFEAALDVRRKGDNSDVYRGEERRLLRNLADSIAAGMTIADIWNRFGDWLYENGKDFANKVRELAELASINAQSEVDLLGQLIAEGGCVYFVGSPSLETVKAVQRALVVRVGQIASKRDRMSGPTRPVFLVLDEFASSMSVPALTSLQQLRDKNVHVALACQSFDDLSGPGLTLDPEYVRGVVTECTPIKVVYRLESTRTAELFARKSGRVPEYKEMIEVERNAGLANIARGSKRLVQSDRLFVPEDLLLNLPPRHAVLFGVGPARVIRIDPVPVTLSPEAIEVKPVNGVSIAKPRSLGCNPVELERDEFELS